MEYRRASHVAWRNIGGETMVVDLKNKSIIGLNEPGGAIWHALDHAGTPERLTETLRATSSNPAGDDGLDLAVGGFLAELHSLGLVVSDGLDSPAAKSEAGNQFPLEGAPVPKIVWRDAIRNFGLSCAKQVGNPACVSVPTT